MPVLANPASGHEPAVRPSTRWLSRRLVVLCAVALLIRIVLILASPHWHPLNPYVDAGEYDRDAVALIHHGSFGVSDATFHGGPTAYHPPLFSIALAGVYAVSGTSNVQRRFHAGRAFEAVLGAIAVGLLYLIALELFGELVAMIAGGLAAIDPPLLLVGSSLMSESLFIPLALGAVLCGLKARAQGPQSLRWAAAAGVLGGLSALTRESGIVLMAALLWLVWTGRPWRSRAALRNPAVMLAATIVVLMPWAIRNESTFHQFEPFTTGTGYALAGAYDHEAQSSHRFPAMWQAPFKDIAAALHQHPHASEAQISSSLITMSLRYIEHNPGSLVKTAYWSTVRLLNLAGPGFERWFAPYEGYSSWLAVLSVYAFWLVALGAIGALVWRPARSALRAGRVPAAFWACPVLMFLASVPFAGSTRYRSPCDPFLLILVAVLLAAVWERRTGERRGRAA